MFEWLTVDVLSTAGLSTIVGGVILAIIQGRLVPKAQVDRLEASHQRQLSDAWAAAHAAGAARDVTQAQLQKLLEAAYPVLRTVEEVAET